VKVALVLGRASLYPLGKDFLMIGTLLSHSAHRGVRSAALAAATLLLPGAAPTPFACDQLQAGG
jgi:hypothetical protein